MLLHCSPIGSTDLVELWCIDQLIDSSTRGRQNPIYHRPGFIPADAFYWQQINLFLSVDTPTGHDRNTWSRTVQAKALIRKDGIVDVNVGANGGVGGKEVNSGRRISVHHNGPDWFSVVMLLNRSRDVKRSTKTEKKSKEKHRKLLCSMLVCFRNETERKKETLTWDTTTFFLDERSMKLISCSDNPHFQQHVLVLLVIFATEPK